MTIEGDDLPSNRCATVEAIRKRFGDEVRITDAPPVDVDEKDCAPTGLGSPRRDSSHYGDLCRCSCVVAGNLFLLYRRRIRDARGLNEYVQILLLQPEMYADHRGKFEAYWLTTGDKSANARSVDAMKSIHRMADGLRDKLMLANVVARNAVAQRGHT